MDNFWGELRRRKVVRVAVAYGIGAWVLLQIGDTVFGLLELPGWVGKLLVGAIVVGLPIALILSWMYDWTPTGIVLTNSDEADVGEVFEYSDPEPINLNELKLTSPKLGELIGRHEERETIRQCLDEAKNGTGGIVLIGGEPGVGKSRLAEEALAAGREMGMLPFTGHAYEDEGAPFIVLTEIIEEAMRILPEDTLRSALGESASEIARVVPDLRRKLTGIGDPIELPPDQQQRYLFNAVLEFFTRLSQCCPLIVLLDDMHWADESSTSLLGHIAPRLTSLPILIVVTYRDVAADMGEAFQRALSNFSRQSFVERINLRQLSVESVADLLANLGGPNPPPQLVDLIYKESSGNAFFVQSIYRHLAEEGQLFDSNGDWVAEVSAEKLAVPDSVRLVIQQRLNHLDDKVCGVLGEAAILGLRFDMKVLEAASSETSADVLEAIEAAESAQLIRPEAVQRDIRYEFVHALVRQTLLDLLSAGRHQRLHFSSAEALVKVFGESEKYSANIARHYYKAGSLADDTTTCRFLVLAGQQALAASSTDESIKHFNRALELCTEDDTEQLATILLERGLALRTLGRWDDARDDWYRALPLLDASRPKSDIAMIYRDLGYYCTWTEQYDDAATLAQRGLEAVGPEPSRERCRLLSSGACTASATGNFTLADKMNRESIAMATAIGDERLLGSEVLLMRIIQFEHSLRGEEMFETGERASEIMRRLGTPWEQSSTLGAALAGSAMTGRFGGIEAITEEVMPMAISAGNLGAQFHCHVNSCLAGFGLGELDRCFDASKAMVDVCAEYQLPWICYGYAFHGLSCFWSGDEAAAADNFRKSIEAPMLKGVHRGAVPGLVVGALARLGDPFALEVYALDLALPELGQDNGNGSWHWCCGKIEAAALLGKVDEAAALLPHVEQFMAQGTSVTWGTGLTAKFAGIAATAAGEREVASKHFEMALRQSESMPHLIDQAEVRQWYAWALDGFGKADDVQRASDLRDAASLLYDEIGITGKARTLSPA